jgi:hypothetical protein
MGLSTEFVWIWCARVFRRLAQRGWFNPLSRYGFGGANAGLAWMVLEHRVECAQNGVGSDCFAHNRCSYGVREQAMATEQEAAGLSETNKPLSK